MLPAHMSVLLNVGRGIDIEICGLDNVFFSTDFSFGLDTGHDLICIRLLCKYYFTS